ncbi:ABC transporter permease [Natronosporangium hydrolyticum]|uniref:Transport permease protein n=2 Tax=Natronosporangium hydrolyticum TaxID=2811111 RepID=A0A895YHX1_9ACTN|nr:ABC transporter permease [Natronosporangium hydrolyticum]
MIQRHIHHLTRNPDQIFTAIMLPTVMLLLFRYMFGGAISVSDTSYVNFLAPGILVVSITLISTSTTLAVQSDMQEGVVDRFRAMPMFDAAVLTGHIVAAVIRGGVAFVVMIGLGLLVGFRPAGGVLEWIGAIAMLLLFAFALSWVSALFGLIAKSTEGASGLALILMFSPYASSAFVPVETVPSGLRAFVEYQPVTPVVDTVRALLLGEPVGSSAWQAIIWWVAVLAIAAPLATRLYRRRFA